MSYSASFKAGLSEFLDSQFLGPLEIDTQALDTHEDMNALAEVWCKAGVRFRENATTTEDKFAVFQIQSLGLLMEAVSYAVLNRRR
jgi:hypothetical protein